MWLETEGLYYGSQNTPESSYYLPEEHWDLEEALICYVGMPGWRGFYEAHKAELVSLLEKNKGLYKEEYLLEWIDVPLYRGSDNPYSLSWTFDKEEAIAHASCERANTVKGNVYTVSGVYGIIIPEEMGIGESEVLIPLSELKGSVITTVDF